MSSDESEHRSGKIEFGGWSCLTGDRVQCPSHAFAARVRIEQMKGQLDRLVEWHGQHRHAVLFCSLLISMAAIPLFSALRLNTEFIEGLLALNLLAAVAPITSTKGRTWLLVALAGGWVLKHGAGWLHLDGVTGLGSAIWTIIAMLAAMRALRYALSAKSIDSDHIFAALSAYLLAGVFMGNVYRLLENYWPGSMIVNGELVQGELPLSTAFYFSFVTLATVGYGDITPHSEVARGVAVVEAVAGQLYLAVMVARLVSLYAGSRRSDA